ncbi:MAG: anti-sigma factor [Gemmatimonadales bacterium]
MNDQWTDRLSEYLDGELEAAQREALEAHLGTCAACRATLEELRGVVARAKGLEDRPPKVDLWPRINARLTPGWQPGVSRDTTVRRFTRRVSFSVPQLLAASIALVLLSGGGAWLALKPDAVAETPQPTATTFTAVSWPSRTDKAVAELQEALTRNESRLDTATVRVVRENLAVIDRAIAEARSALEADPASTYLNLHLANTMRRKMELLRRVNAIAAARS